MAGLEETLRASPFHGFLARGYPELAIDGLDVRSHGAGGDVEDAPHLPGGELTGEEPQHVQLALRELLAGCSLPSLARAEPSLFALEKRIAQLVVSQLIR